MEFPAVVIEPARIEMPQAVRWVDETSPEEFVPVSELSHSQTREMLEELDTFEARFALAIAALRVRLEMRAIETSSVPLFGEAA